MAPAIRLILLLAIALWPGAAAAGEVREGQLAPSPALGRALPYAIYLPEGHDAAGDDATGDDAPGDDAPGARFPVLYVLHGYGAGQREWFRGGLAAALSHPQAVSSLTSRSISSDCRSMICSASPSSASRLPRLAASMSSRARSSSVSKRK